MASLSDLPTPVGRLLGGADASGVAADAWYAYGADRDREVAPRTVAAGPDAIEAALEDDLGIRVLRPDVHVWIATESDCLLEGSLVERSTGERTASFYASFQLAGGEIVRALTYRCDPVEASDTWDACHEATHDARTAVDGYFHDLDAARLDAAAAWFSDDVLYSHPPYYPGAPRAEFRGMGQLLAGFEKRGPRTNHHEVTVCLQNGRDCLIEGYSHKPEQNVSGQFVSSLSLDADGRIRRYVALYCEPSVGRR